MKRIELTRSAAEALEDITHWTPSNFGTAQSEKYHRELIQRIRKLAAEEPPRGRPLSSLLSWLPADTEWHYYMVGRHFIVYRDSADCIVVTDFIHGARDIARYFSHDSG
jgi:plasmid stabilization system protein ParE